jgi:hypothetical protein
MNAHRLCCVLLCGLGFALAAPLPATAQIPPAPPQLPIPIPVTDANKDQVAWDLFINAVISAGIPNVQAAYFETWASDADVFSFTPHWPAPPVSGAPVTKRLQPSVLRAVRTGMHGLPTGRPAIVGAPGPTTNPCTAPPPPADWNFPAGGCIAEEVRRNLASYNYIVTPPGIGMNTQPGMKKLYAAGTTVDFPPEAVEVKADWVPVQYVMQWIPGMTSTQLVEQNYYTNFAPGTPGAPPVEYALFSVHISSKWLPNWVWASFEHQLNLGRCDTMGCLDAYGTTQPAVSPNLAASNTTYPACTKTPALVAAMNAAGLAPQWQNYCLKATQINFTNPAASNNAILAGDSVTERVLAGVPIEQSSCITCHAYAAYTATGAANTNGLQNNNIGAVNNTLLANSKTADFIWGILFAPKAPSRP